MWTRRAKQSSSDNNWSLSINLAGKSVNQDTDEDAGFGTTAGKVEK